MKVKQTREMVKRIESLMSDLEKVDKSRDIDDSIEESIECYSGVKSFSGLLIDTVAYLGDYRSLLNRAIEEADIPLI